MKPARRLGKGLAALVHLHAGTDEEAPADDSLAPGAPSAGVLQLLSTPVEEPVVATPCTGSETGSRTAPGTTSSGDPAAGPEAEPAAVAPPALGAPPREAVALAAAPVLPTPVAPQVPDAAPACAAPRAPETPAEQEPAPAPVPAPHEPLVEDGPAFLDEWFDAPVATFQPAAGLERTAPPAHPSVAAPSSQAPAATPARAAERPAAVPPRAPPPPSLPESEVQAVPADAVQLEDDAYLVEDFVVGSHLPDVDLDS